MADKNYDAAWLTERGEYFNNLFLEIKDLKTQNVFLGKRICIVGSWNHAREVKEIVEKLDLKIELIADNNPRKQGVSRLGIISQSIESLINEKDIVILVINNFFWKDITIQLKSIGFIEGRDYYVLFGGERYRRSSQAVDDPVPTNEDWKDLIEKANEGFRAYYEINNKYNGLPIWLMHQPSLGDLYIFSLYLPHAMGKRSIQECECVLIVTKNSVKKLAEILGFRHIEIITFDEANKNWLMMLRIAGNEINVHNAVFHGLSNNFQTMVHYSKISFSESFTKWVFRFDKEVDPIYPMFPKRKEHVLKQFEENHLIPGKTVVISPYAGHFVADIPDNEWVRIVEELKRKGYTVCTNTGGPNEHAIPGTVAPFIELQDCVEFVDTAGYFIGVRSGFCDLICNSECKKTIIYETGAPAGDIVFFGFNSMKLGKNIREVINDCIHTNKIIDDILEDY